MSRAVGTTDAAADVRALFVTALGPYDDSDEAPARQAVADAVVCHLPGVAPEDIEAAVQRVLWEVAS